MGPLAVCVYGADKKPCPSTIHDTIRCCASTVYAVVVCLSVHLCVCLSHSGIVSKRLNVNLQIMPHDSAGTLVF